MALITGLGGVFYKVADPEKTRRWYQDNLGIGGEWGAMFPYKKDDPEGFTLYSPFKADTDYFGPSDQPFMVNLRVDDLDGVIADLEGKGIDTGWQVLPPGQSWSSWIEIRVGRIIV